VPYGLHAYIATGDAQRGQRVARQLQAGRVMITRSLTHPTPLRRLQTVRLVMISSNKVGLGGASRQSPDHVVAVRVGPRDQLVELVVVHRSS
jgi:acyl-CoA reductase-like NAD-dependent aldehyde dehydrogenase